MKNNNSCLANKSCIPCQGGIPPLGIQVANNLLEELGNGWLLNAARHLYKRYTFSDFMGTTEFANEVAAIAEQEGHHPDLRIAWGECIVEIWTHKIEGLTESDFILAAKIKAIA
ncbi:MAG: 4a-hydroxytetrahydrobiopterin dehydratase [Alphaproteobacteria bacterium 41-28]|nr:MAG: 4a-hydroxytetrahydrobiopterin dehydratase [Alphaproteobacteria bacterium 41-28]